MYNIIDSVKGLGNADNGWISGGEGLTTSKTEMYTCSQHLVYAEFKTPSVFSLCCHFLQSFYSVCCAFSNLLIGQGLVCVHVGNIGGVCQSLYVS